VGIGNTRETVVEKDRQAYTNQLKNDLESLGNQPIFGPYNKDKIELGIDTTGSDFFACIKDFAPSLYTLLETLCRDRRTNSPKMPSRTAAIVQIMLFTKNQRKCNFQ
jgi:hypothetical protein